MREARERLEPWLRRAPNSAPALIWKARLALAERRMAEAAEALQRAKLHKASREDLDVLFALARAIGGEFLEAEPILRDRFNARVEPDPLLDEILSRIYLETYDLPRARVALKRWMLEFPKDPKPYLWRAEVDTRAGDTEQAMNDYREALTRDFQLAPALLGLAEELRKAHRNTEAAKTFNDYLSLKPEDPLGHLGAGRCLVESGDDTAATRHLEKTLTLAPDDSVAHRVLGDVLIRQGQFPGALAHLDKAEAIDPFDLEIRHARGLVLSHLGRLDEAKSEQAIAARLRAEQEALFQAQAKLVSVPTDLEAKLTITRWLFAHGKATEAVRWADAILRENPVQPDSIRLLADHYEKIGQAGLANSYRARIAE
jgi:tetratricopeptide (TPR) repeat protein